MSTTFANIVVRSGDHRAVAAAVRQLPRRLGAFVAPPVNSWVAVFDEASDAPDEDRLSGYTLMLSAKLQTQAAGFLVYESDVLLMTLADQGRLVGHYSSWPDYFDESLPEEEYDALTMDSGAVASILRAPRDTVAGVLDAEHDFAEETLADLVKAAGLPATVSGWGYNDIVDAEGTEPEGRESFIHIAQAFVLDPNQ